MRLVPLLWLAGCCLYFAPPVKLCDEACAKRGECSVRTERAGDGAYRCYAATNADCQASEACRTRGHCAVAENGECVAPSRVPMLTCATSPQCRTWGGCQPRDGFCEPVTDADCQQSLQCATEGRCAVRNHTCIAKSDADCAGSLGCTLDGLCVLDGHWLYGGRCAVPDDATACRQSLGCTQYGRCERRNPVGCAEGCRLFFCGKPGETVEYPCTHVPGTFPQCAVDGRCIRDHDNACVRVPATPAGP